MGEIENLPWQDMVFLFSQALKGALEAFAMSVKFQTYRLTQQVFICKVGKDFFPLPISSLMAKDLLTKIWQHNKIWQNNLLNINSK